MKNNPWIWFSVAFVCLTTMIGLLTGLYDYLDGAAGIMILANALTGMTVGSGLVLVVSRVVGAATRELHLYL